jgi:xanthine dehydrogenase small subunit
MKNSISFVLDGAIKEIDFDKEHTPTTTVLNYLRKSPCHKGVKEGCAEGDCGACTVVIGEAGPGNSIIYKAIDSCLVFLPMLQGKQLITVENLEQKTISGKELHPVQEAMVNCNGSQCGYCTPGIVMSLLALYKNEKAASLESVNDALTGNLCRCTGYKPIVEAAMKSCAKPQEDVFSRSEGHVAGLFKELKAKQKSLAIHSGAQRYDQPLTKAEALALRKDSPDSILLGGATDIGLRVTKRHETLLHIIDLSQIAALKEINESEKEFRLGAGLDLESLRLFSEKHIPVLAETLTVFGSRQIRSLATLGGNLGSGSPIGDTLPTLMACNADIVLESTSGERRVPMNKFLLSYRKTERRPDELITAVIIPKPDKALKLKFYKVSKRKDLDISTVSAGFSVLLRNKVVESITLAYGGMAAVTQRASAAEAYLIGKEWGRAEVEKAMPLIASAFSPISDARSGAAFRTLAAKNLLLKFWSETSN